MVRLKPQHIFWLKTIIHLSALIPLVWTFWLAISGTIGGDPVKAVIHFTGIGAFNLLLISLLVSPVAKKFRQALLVKVRRVLGLYSFVYGLIHLLSYLAFDLQFAWGLLARELIERTYITIGFSSLIILLALTLTSTQWSQRKLGRTWQKLHNWVYLAGILASVHFLWSVKSDIIEPIIYITITCILLYLRKEKFIPKKRS
jgi:sulfoxide reductase heme-binding subunit YedZ